MDELIRAARAGRCMHGGSPGWRIKALPAEYAMIARRPDRSTPGQKTALLVLGMHRSGTSVLARVLSFLGASLPRHLVPASDSNPTGHWEPARLVELHQQLLAALGTSWDDWRAPQMRWQDGDAAHAIASKIPQVLDEEYGTAPLIVLKDPRICRTLPFWLPTLEKAGYRTTPVIMVRNPLEVAESLRERDGMSFEKAMLLWLRHYLDAEYATRNNARNIMSLDMLMDNWPHMFAQTASRLGLNWPRSIQSATQDIRDFIDRELHNHRSTIAELESHTEVPFWVKTAYRALNTLCDEPRANDPRRELDRVRQHFTESTKLFGVVAFAQTEALAQAERDVAEARARADAADALRKALASEQAANSDLSTRHETLARQSRQTTEQLEATRNRAAQAEQLAAAHQAEIATLQGQVAELSAAATQAHARAQTAETRAKAAESNAAKLIRDIAELEKSRNELSLTLSRMTTDASDLRSMAENVSRRTEWIEAEIRKQAASAQPVRAELDAANVRILSLSDELKAALANAMTLSRELSAAKEQIHSHEKRAIELAAHAKTQANAASRADQRVAQLEAEQQDAKAQIAELRAELAETRALGRNQRPIEPDLQTTQSAPPSATLLPALPGSEVSDMRTRARRIEEDLRFERMHVQQLEQRLNSWSGLAGAMLRKITRFNTEPAPQRRQSARKRIKASTAPTRS